MNVACSLYSNTAELVQAIKYLFLANLSFLSNRLQHQEKVVRGRVSQILLFATQGRIYKPPVLVE